MSNIFSPEFGGSIPARFLVGDRVEVLNGARVGEVEKVLGVGVVEGVVDAGKPEAVYVVSGFPIARPAKVLRLIMRGER